MTKTYLGHNNVTVILSV